MEVRYPFLIILIILIFILYFVLFRKKKNNFTKGSKIANTEYIKNTDYYKNMIKKYNIYKTILLILFIICFICSSILIMRLSKVKVINNKEYNRDIFLCMDVSASVDELNLDLIDNLKKAVNNLHGERFGISIFNTTSVVLVPLTEDYDYVSDVLDQIKKSIKVNNSSRYGSNYNDDYLYTASYIYSGTLEGNDIRGSSLIGDGLASCVYSFSNLDADRSRIIILSTDNDLEGTPIVTLEKAAQISKSKNIKVFGVGTKQMKDQDRIDFKNAVNITNGKYYDHSRSTANSIVNDIDSTSKTLLKKQVETREIDLPEIPFVIMLISMIGIIFISKKVI